jgi:hypothetical protein
MMIMICRALNVFALQGKPPSQWSVDRIRGINRIFSRMNLLPMLSQEAGPVECKEREADRVIPSIDNIYKQKWVDRDRLGGILDQLF